jgi:tetratricopeptide (TPR) repeat protein
MTPSRSQTAALVCAAALVVFASGCEKLRARDHLNKGVASFKGAKFADAAEHFKKAVELDPEFSTPRLYLATAYMQQYIPGAESPENLEMARKANEEFMTVLSNEPDNKLAIESMASLRYTQAQGLAELDAKLAKLDEAREWYEKLVAVDPESKSGWYSLAVITWLKWYPEYKQARDRMGMKPEEPGPLKDKKVKDQLKAKWEGPLNAAIGHLEKALAVDNEYDDAMAYMNLLIRQKADLADTKEETAAQVKIADDWIQKALEAKKIKAQRLEQKGAVITD